MSQMRDHDHVTVPYSDDQLAEGVRRALKAGDVDGMCDFLQVLAAVNPQWAREVMDTIERALTIAERATR